MERCARQHHCCHCERLEKYPSVMGEAVVVRNKIAGLDEREKLDEGKAYFGKDGNDSIGS